MPGQHNAVNELRHDFRRHFTGFIHKMIQGHRHGSNLTHGMLFDKGQPQSARQAMFQPPESSRAAVVMNHLRRPQVRIDARSGTPNSPPPPRSQDSQIVQAYVP